MHAVICRHILLWLFWSMCQLAVMAAVVAQQSTKPNAICADNPVQTWLHDTSKNSSIRVSNAQCKPCIGCGTY